MSEAVEQINEEAPITLKITTAGIKAEFEGTNGRKVFKNIGLGAMSRVLNRDSEFDTGFLPIFGRNYMGIKRYIKMGDREILFIEASPANRLVKYGYSDIKEYTNVRFPGLMMAVLCNVNRNGTLSINQNGTRIFATRGPILRDTDQLYRYPFGNVYQPDGRICWGSAQRDQNHMKTLAHLGSLLDSFLFSAMNDDLYGSGSTRGRGNLESHLTSLQDLNEFPYEELMAEVTFRDLTSLLKSKNVR